MKFVTAMLAWIAILGAFAESRHPCVYFRAGELPSLREKAQNVAWARDIVKRWRSEAMPSVARQFKCWTYSYP